ncbi:MAG: hypothetical protein R3A10_14490 [Caldilineaceae bacterium]
MAVRPHRPQHLPTTVRRRLAATTSERCGDPGQLDKELNVYNWTDYIDPEIISQLRGRMRRQGRL